MKAWFFGHQTARRGFGGNSGIDVTDAKAAVPVAEKPTSPLFRDPNSANLARNEPNYRIGDKCDRGPAAILCGSPRSTGTQFSGIDFPGNDRLRVVNRPKIAIAGPKPVVPLSRPNPIRS